MCLTKEPHRAEELVRSNSGNILRKKIWELDSVHHCSIVGTCLTLDELKSLSRKLSIRIPEFPSDYELHRIFVSVAGENSFASKYLHKFIDRKFRRVNRKTIDAIKAGEIEAYWDEAVKSGHVAAVYWGIMTHTGIPGTLLDRIYGEVHMLSHLSGASIRMDIQDLNRLRVRSASLAQQLADSRTKVKLIIKEKNKFIRDLNSQLQQTQAKPNEMAGHNYQYETNLDSDYLKNLEADYKETLSLLELEKVRAARAQQYIQKWKHRALKLEKRNKCINDHCEELGMQCHALESALEKQLKVTCSDAEIKGCEKAANLCGKCILYVGGRSRQCAHFRTLVENQNGQFIHHDGGLHESRSRLSSILPQVDLVLCPLDCVSHDAAKHVKQFCKRYGKQLVLLPRASLAAFTRGLNELVS